MGQRELLYHYTTLESFEKIITNRTIRFYHSRHMNDALEGVWILNMIKDKLKESNPDRVVILNQLFEDIRSMPNFLFCMSEEHNLLSMWTRYADDGRGVVLAFDKEKFVIDRKIPKQELSKYNSLGLFKCVYSESEHEEKIVSTYRRIKEVDDDAYNELIDYSLSCKHEGFAEEKEWRIGNRVFEDARTYTPTQESEKVKTQISASEIKQFVDISFETIFGTNFPIVGVIIGPQSRLHHDDLYRHIESLGVSNRIDILYSGIPYKGKK